MNADAPNKTSDSHANLVWLDQLCDRFEASWGTPKQFSPETALNELPSEKHSAVLKALLQLETELRADTNEPVTEAELIERFPDHQQIVESVFGNPGVPDSLAGQQTIAPQNAVKGNPAESQVGAPSRGGVRIPRQLGRYRIIRKLGQGAMGSVFLAHDGQLDREVALKIPRGDVQRNKELRARFQREAQAAAALHHPNICPIYDIGEFHDIHYICMGYIEGFSLSRFAVAESGLSEQRIAELVLKLAQALAVAHEAGFIHRDLKPANVMMNDQDEPVILDFGLARRIDPNEDTRVTQTGTTIGSPAYMSPEQVDGDQAKIGQHSDIYSLGVILYELLTGRIPFEGSMASVLGQIMTKEPDKPSNYRRDLSVRLENICLRMMAKDPEKRHPSMHAVVAAMNEYLEKYSVSMPATEETASSAESDAATKKGELQKKRIQALMKSGDYAQAEKLLVTLSRETDEDQLEAATWAADELPKLRKTREEVRAGRQEIYNTAARLMKAHDYEQAMRLLEEYPFDMRTPKMQDLLERAEGLSNEVQLLRKHIKSARTRGDNKHLLQLLRDLLELKPADRKAKELVDQLTRKPVLVRVAQSIRDAFLPQKTGTKKGRQKSQILLVVRMVLLAALVGAVSIGYSEVSSRSAYESAIRVLQTGMDESPPPLMETLETEFVASGATTENVADGVRFQWPSWFNEYVLTVNADGFRADGFYTGTDTPSPPPGPPNPTPPPESVTDIRTKLKAIAVAFHNYHDTHGHFPEPGGSGAESPFSWRVELLPFLGEQALYSEFARFQNWDGSNNQPMLSRMPDVFHIGASTSETTVQMIVGPGTAARNGNPIRLRDIVGGASNTILAVVTSEPHAVPWTKPADVTADEISINELPSGITTESLCILADGRVTTIGDISADGNPFLINDSETATESLTPKVSEPVTVDLLQLLNLDRDHKSGNWSRNAGESTVVVTGQAEIACEVEVPLTYTIIIKFRRTKGDESLNLNFPVGAHLTELLLDAYPSRGGQTFLRGRHRGLSIVQGQRIINDQEQTLEVKVDALDPENSIVSVLLNDDAILGWKGATADLRGNQYLAPSDGISMQVWGQAYEIMDARLIHDAAAPKRPVGRYRSFHDSGSVVIPGLKYSGEYPVTIEAIVTPNSLGRTQSVFSNQNASGIGLVLQSSGHVKFEVVGANGFTRAVSNAPIPIGTTTHLAGTCDGKRIKLYVDGKQQDSSSSFTRPHKPGTRFMIGGDPQDINPNRPHHNFDGVIHAVRMSNKVLYTNDFSAPEELTASQTTVACFKLDGTSGNRLTDVSGNGHDGICRAITTTDDLPAAPNFVIKPATHENTRWRISMKRQTSSNWLKPGFNDQQWAEASGGFGTTLSDSIRTIWKTENLYGRRSFSLTSRPRSGSLFVSSDCTCGVYLNGQFCGASRSTDGYARIRLSTQVLESLTTGTNTLSFFCRNSDADKSASCEVDMGLSLQFD